MAIGREQVHGQNNRGGCSHLRARELLSEEVAAKMGHRMGGSSRAEGQGWGLVWQKEQLCAGREEGKRWVLSVFWMGALSWREASKGERH